MVSAMRWSVPVWLCVGVVVAASFAVGPSAGARERKPGGTKSTAVAASAVEAVKRPVASSAKPKAPAAAPASAEPDAAKLKAILQNAPGKPTAVGYVVDLDSGKTIMNLNGGRVVYPASVSKMFTTAALARATKPTERLRTTVYARYPGTNNSPMSIVGSGDPSLTSKQLIALAGKVARTGTKSVKWLYIDTTIFDGKLPRGYNEKQSDSAYRAPIGGLQVDSGTVFVSITPGAMGQPPRVALRPEGGRFITVNKAKTVKGRFDKLQVSISGKGRRTVVTVTGTLGIKRRRVAVRRRVHDASFVAGSVFAAALRRAGVDVRVVKFAKLRADMKPIASHVSPPMVAMATRCNQTSHNGFAETFFKLLGARKIGRPGSSAKGEQATKQVLADFGINWTKVRLGNGSGLYHANKVTAKDVVKLLKGMDRLGKKGAQWRRSLAIAGVAGTLKRRLRGPATRRRVYAKTGTLDDVTALAGYAFTAKRRYAFATFFNDVKAPARIYRRVHDRFLETLLDPSGQLTRKARAASATRKPKKKRKSATKRASRRGRSKRGKKR